MCRDGLLLCKQIKCKNKSQESIHKNRQDRGCRAPCHGENPAFLVTDQGGDLLNQPIRVYDIFGQDNVIFCSKLDNASPPPPDFLHIDRNVLDKLIAGFPQAGEHHKHHSKQNSKDEHGACCQAHGAGQLCRSFAARLVPAAFHWPKNYVDQKSNRAADQKRSEQCKHLAEKTQNSVKVYQRPCEYNKQQKSTDDIANDRLVRPFASLRCGCFIFVRGWIFQFFLHVFPFCQYRNPFFKSESTFAGLYPNSL